MATDPSKPQVRKGTGPDQLPQGAAQRLNTAFDALQSPSEDILKAANEDPQPSGQVTNFDDILFSGTDHPNEPITTGVSFGPGPSFTRRGTESDRDFLTRAAGDIASSPAASSRVKSFAARVARGE